MRALKYIFAIFCILVFGCVLFYKFVILRDLEERKSYPQYRIESHIGYAPYKFSVHKGWIPDKRFEYPAFRRRISDDLPRSNFHIEIQVLKDVVGNKDITLDEYVDDYVIKELEEIHKAKLLSVEDAIIDKIPAKSIIYKYSLTINNLTHEIKSKTEILLIGGYVYIFDLGSFEKDFDIANKEVELMVNSFHFTDEPPKD